MNNKETGPHYEDRLERIFAELKGSEDVMIQTVGSGENRECVFRIISCGGMVDMQTMFMALLPQLDNLAKRVEQGNEKESAETSHPTRPGGTLGTRLLLENKEDESHFYSCLYSGSVLVVHEQSRLVFQFDISSQPGRQPEESAMELSLKGPRDGFVEKIAINIALVRRRLRTPDLHCEYLKIGSESKTEIALLYVKGEAETTLVEEARRRLNSIKIENLYGASELEDLISDRPISLFPLVEYIGRPDYVVHSLMNGRIAIMVDGNPTAIIAPANLSLLVKSPEDDHLPFYFVTLERILRIMGFILALCLPGFWIALSCFNIDQVPFTLLATVTVSRFGLPMTATMEMFMMLLMFELFREAGVRLPRAVGQTVSVVGGLIIGDAAIVAGLTSPTMLVVAAITAVATFTLVNQSLSGSVSVIRYGILTLSALFGIFGFFISIFVVLIYMCSLESFGHPYLEPLAPIEWKKLGPALIQSPWKVKIKGGRK